MFTWPSNFKYLVMSLGGAMIITEKQSYLHKTHWHEIGALKCGKHFKDFPKAHDATVVDTKDEWSGDKEMIVDIIEFDKSKKCTCRMCSRNEIGARVRDWYI